MEPRTLKIVTGAGRAPGTYELAVDPERSTLDTALRVATLAEEARFDFLFTADLLRFDAQGAPVQIQAGQSEAGMALGARYAEIVFTSLPTLQIAQEYTTKIRGMAARQGRPEGLPWIFSSFHATYGATEAEAKRKLHDNVNHPFDEFPGAHSSN